MFRSRNLPKLDRARSKYILIASSRVEAPQNIATFGRGSWIMKWAPPPDDLSTVQKLNQSEWFIEWISTENPFFILKTCDETKRIGYNINLWKVRRQNNAIPSHCLIKMFLQNCFNLTFKSHTSKLLYLYWRFDQKCSSFSKKKLAQNLEMLQKQ